MAKIIHTGGPAFPLAIDKQVLHDGMTLRDYFAAKAMQGLLAGKLQSVELKVIAGDCYKMADAMLKAREA
jgi:hypothetical protein